jgi:hypothetical protein
MTHYSNSDSLFYKSNHRQKEACRSMPLFPHLTLLVAPAAVASAVISLLVALFIALPVNLFVLIFVA